MYYRNGCGALQSCRNLPSVKTLLSQSPSVVNTGRPLKMAAELHPRSGKLIGLSNSNRTARRNQPVQEFNHGLVLSKEPLRDRDVFTVRIDKKVNNNRPGAAASPAGVRAAGMREQRCWDGPVVCLCPQWGASVTQGGSHCMTATSVCAIPLRRVTCTVRDLLATGGLMEHIPPCT